MKTLKILSLLSIFILISSCQSKKNEYDPYAFEDNSKTKQVEKASFEVDFKKTEANLKTIHVKLNDNNGYDAIFDTGCSGMLISTLEMAELIKSGTITKDDYVGTSPISIADGNIVNQPMYRIREVTILDKKGKPHTVRDVTATVVYNPVAKVLVGSAVIDNLAKKSYTIDLKKRVIRFE